MAQASSSSQQEQRAAKPAPTLQSLAHRLIDKRLVPYLDATSRQLTTLNMTEYKDNMTTVLELVDSMNSDDEGRQSLMDSMHDTMMDVVTPGAPDTRCTLYALLGDGRRAHDAYSAGESGYTMQHVQTVCMTALGELGRNQNMVCKMLDLPAVFADARFPSSAAVVHVTWWCRMNDVVKQWAALRGDLPMPMDDVAVDNSSGVEITGMYCFHVLESCARFTSRQRVTFSV